MEYLTDEDLAIAEANGINRQRAKRRYYTEGMDKQEAITKPITPFRGPYNEYREVCEENGVSRDLFNARKRRGWTNEDACKPAEKKHVWSGYL